MLDLLLVPVALIYMLVVGMLFVYGINFFYLTWLTVRERKGPLQRPPWRAPSQAAPEHWPPVTVQLPIYNEMYVAERLIRSAAALDYPAEALEIQVLDDSTDETVELVAGLVAELRRAGADIVHLHRRDRQGYKAGALAAGFEAARGEFLAVFDADFLPGPDFLKRVIPQFENPEVGFVQTRWGHVNRDYSFLTLLQSLAIDAHFMVEQFARSQAGFIFNFNGTGGVWRKATIRDAGGWKAETLTEDLDLSYRAFLNGWRAVYLRDVEVPAELPVSFSAYRRQQHRWARGSLECARKFVPIVWRAPLSLPQKIEATLHLTGYGVHLLLCALVFIYPLVLLLARGYPELVSLFGIAFFFNATALAPTIFFLVAQRELGAGWWKKIPVILFITALGAGMMVNTLRAFLQIFGRRNAVFERTPKFGIVQRRQKWMDRRYQLRLDPIVFYEVIFAVLNLVTVIMAVHAQNWAIALYAGLFAIGLGFTSGLTVLQTLAVRQSRAFEPTQARTA